jgi:plastocyanin
MRKILSVAAVAAVVFVFADAPVSAAAKAPVDVGEKVTNKGTKNVSGKTNAKIEEELDDKYFKPTFIKAKAGQTIAITAKNEGSLPHTFTSDALSVDKELQPGKTAKFTITVPSSGEAFQFHCTFHESQGMVGAVFTKAGASVSGSATNSSASSGAPGY